MTVCRGFRWHLSAALVDQGSNLLFYAENRTAGLKPEAAVRILWKVIKCDLQVRPDVPDVVVCLGNLPGAELCKAIDLC
jgi:hypothetical protein